MFKYLGKTKVSYQELIKGYLPKYKLDCKQKAFERALQVHEHDDGDIEVSHVMCDNSISDEVLTRKKFKLIMDRDFYDYRKARAGEDTWFVNFADPELFVAAEGTLFAQDEIQTLEMPLLAAFRRYVDSNHIGGFAPYTQYSGNPTPYLFKNVPYWIKVDTRPLLRNGTRGNIYGSNLVTASDKEIEAGIRTVDGEYRVNVLAIAAPGNGFGRYNTEEISLVVRTLLCAFSAVKAQSTGRVVIHSGNWGCGAFGGNLEFMYLAQMYAASVCGIDELVLHDIKYEVEDSIQAFNKMQDGMKLADVVESLYSKGYEWKESDGN